MGHRCLKVRKGNQLGSGESHLWGHHRKTVRTSQIREPDVSNLKYRDHALGAQVRRSALQSLGPGGLHGPAQVGAGLEEQASGRSAKRSSFKGPVDWARTTLSSYLSITAALASSSFSFYPLGAPCILPPTSSPRPQVSSLGNPGGRHAVMSGHPHFAFPLWGWRRVFVGTWQSWAWLQPCSPPLVLSYQAVTWGSKAFWVGQVRMWWYGDIIAFSYKYPGHRGGGCWI